MQWVKFACFNDNSPKNNSFKIFFIFAIILLVFELKTPLILHKNLHISKLYYIKTNFHQLFLSPHHSPKQLIGPHRFSMLLELSNPGVLPDSCLIAALLDLVCLSGLCVLFYYHHHHYHLHHSPHHHRHLHHHHHHFYHHHHHHPRRKPQ